jgi:hypothetical protein
LTIEILRKNLSDVTVIFLGRPQAGLLVTLPVNAFFDITALMVERLT